VSQALRPLLLRPAAAASRARPPRLRQRLTPPEHALSGAAPQRAAAQRVEPADAQRAKQQADRQAQEQAEQQEVQQAAQHAKQRAEQQADHLADTALSPQRAHPQPQHQPHNRPQHQPPHQPLVHGVALVCPVGEGRHAVATELLASVAAPGMALDAGTRQFFETRFGHDFSQVRVHADSRAQQAADSVQARAFTYGRHLVFAAGEYQPHSQAGRRLLAHELAHVMQQQGRAPVVQRQPSNKRKKPAVDVTKLTDQEKAELRERIRQMALNNLASDKANIDALGPMTDAQRSAADALRKQFDGFIARAQSRASTDPEKPVRVRALRALRRLLDDPYAMREHLEFGLIKVAVSQRMADPADKADASQLAAWATDAQRAEGGYDAMSLGFHQAAIHEDAGIKPEDLKTDDLTEAEQEAAAASPGATPPSSNPGDPKPPTAQDQARLRDVVESIPDSVGETQIADQRAIMEQLAQMSDEDLDAFKRFLKHAKSTDPTNPDAVSMDKLLEHFRKLSVAEREALEINLDLEGQTDQPAKLDEAMRLHLKSSTEDAAQMKSQLKSVASDLDRMRQLIRDPNLTKDIPDLGLGSDEVLDEVIMIEGLLAGSSDQSPLAKQVAQTLTAEITIARWELAKKLAAAAAEAGGMALLAAVTQGGSTLFTGARMVRLIKVINDLRKAIETLRKAYSVYRRIEAVITTVRGLGSAYEDFKAFYDHALGAVEMLQAKLGDIDSAEDLEAKLEAEEDQLMDELDTLLEGKFGEMLEFFYIPDDTSNEELLRILANLPRGLDRLGEMWDFYNSPGKSDPEHGQRLAQFAFHAGALLHPFVAMLAALVSSQVSALTARMQLSLTMDRLVPKAKRSGAKDRNRGLFKRLNRKRYDITDAVLKPHLTKGANDLRALLDKDEPGAVGDEHWTPDWFKHSLRREVKVLNANFRGTKVTAQVKDKAAKKAAKGATTESVALPAFKLKFDRFKLGGNKVSAKLKLNPEEEIQADRLSDDDFKKPIPFLTTDVKRQATVREWLQDEGYKLIKDPLGKPHVRLPDGKEGNNKRHYLRIDGAGALVHGIDAEDQKPFLDAKAVIADSNDLPEGYKLRETAKGIEIARKDGVERLFKLPALGLDANHQLVAGAQKPVPRQIAAPGMQEATRTEAYDWTLAAQTMASAPGDYNMQRKSSAWWGEHIKKNDALKRRPTQAVGNLGYIVNARAGSDTLSSFHLPLQHGQDDRGHIVARRFGGVDSYDNLVPMLRSLNQAPGKWFDVEHDMAKIYTSKAAKPGHYVRFNVDMQYLGKGTRRPSKFKVSWQEKKSAKMGVVADNDPVVETHPARALDNT